MVDRIDPERLRSPAPKWAGKIMRDQDAEIERLRKENEELRYALKVISRFISAHHKEGDTEYQVVLVANQALQTKDTDESDDAAYFEWLDNMRSLGVVEESALIESLKSEFHIPQEGAFAVAKKYFRRETGKDTHPRCPIHGQHQTEGQPCEYCEMDADEARCAARETSKGTHDG